MGGQFLGRFSTAIIARLSMLRVFSGRPSRPHTEPQQYSVTRSCSGCENSSASAAARCTYSAPSTVVRISRPFS
ncbi:hypothetical protein ASJ79_16085 [Mycobacterium sp. NAZ190054]|nr:hypothetical protein ASJ79_16085 [Mycobacterium sp. NAZ190054]